MWVCLNDEGKKVWGDIFPEGTVPVRSMVFERASLEGERDSEEVVLVSWSALATKQQNSILQLLSAKFGVCDEVIRREILKVGLPLRKSYTTGVISAELRYFI